MIIGLLVLVGIVLFQVGDLKELGKRNFRRARRLVHGSRVAESAALPTFYADGVDFSVVPTARTLIRNGIVLSLDPQVGDFSVGDVLIDRRSDRRGGLRPGGRRGRGHRRRRA